ncbi:MAG TPA: hypothetical protein VH187_05565 [Scandinavium sp.]|uniref:hypothetical protein n=1 Tax=Scandinavium sp. TaxID=2830653 RepID=UPI002E35E5A9|nr:hypothetical protein [Scandinavium sp.]HEX4500629.1 hypothetical protein [Scandinavium sp.]
MPAVLPLITSRVTMLRPGQTIWNNVGGTAWSPTWSIPDVVNPAFYGKDWDVGLNPNSYGIIFSGSTPVTTATVSFGATSTAPDGTLTAVKLIEAANNNQHYITAGYFTLENLTTYALRLGIVVQVAGRTRIAILANDSDQESANSVVGPVLPSANPGGVEAVFDLAGGQVAVVSTAFGTGWLVAGPATIAPLAGSPGWYFCTVDFVKPNQNATGRGIVKCVIKLDNGSGTAAKSDSYLGDGTSGVLIWRTCLLPPTAWGFNNQVFFEDFLDTSGIDMNNTRAPGFNIYVNNFWPGIAGPNPTLAANIVVSGSKISFLNNIGTNGYLCSAAYAKDCAQFNGNLNAGVLTVNASGPGMPQVFGKVTTGQHITASNVPNATTQVTGQLSGIIGGAGTYSVTGTQVLTNTIMWSYAAFGYSTANYVGRVWQPPAYFEINGQFDAHDHNTVPSVFWAFAMEGMLVPDPNAAFPPGVNALEHDYVENIVNDMVPGDALIDWHQSTTEYAGSGPYIFPMIGGNSNNGPVPIDFSLFHTYGTIWIPITGSTEATSGLIVKFFDGCLARAFSYGPAVNVPVLAVPADAFNEDTTQHWPFFFGGGTAQWDWIRIITP